MREGLRPRASLCMQRYVPTNSPRKKRRTNVKSDSAHQTKSLSASSDADIAENKEGAESPTYLSPESVPAHKANHIAVNTRTFTAQQVSELRKLLLDWYTDNHRQLPWRTPPRHRKNGLPPIPKKPALSASSPGAPYAVWVSEVMSQQTRIQVVVNYYNRWMHEFPTIEHLATAPLDRVNEIWSGLGYYRRARFLHEGAKQVVDKYAGQLPADADSLMKLKGIGKYTAGAISSIAFGKAAPLVDGNVERVFSRLRSALTTTPHQSKSLENEYWGIASKCVQDIENAGDFNQALMELGATVCKPRAVQCCSCPLTNLCDAFKEAQHSKIDTAQYVTRYPIKDMRKKVKVRKETALALVVCVEDKEERRFLLTQRQGSGLLAGLWEAPNKILKNNSVEEQNEAFRSLMEELNKTYGLIPQHTATSDYTFIDAGCITHIFSHIRQSLFVRAIMLRRDDSSCFAAGTAATATKKISSRWLNESELKGSAISKQMRKVIGAALTKLKTEENG